MVGTIEKKKEEEEVREDVEIPDIVEAKELKSDDPDLSCC